MPADAARTAAAARSGPSEAAMAELADLVLVLARELVQNPAGEEVKALTPTEAAVLRCIDRHPRATPSAVAQATGMQRSNLSATLRSLESAGLVVRSLDNDDRRRVLLRLTPRAREHVARLRTSWAARVRQGLGPDTEGVEAAVALLARLEAGLAPTDRH